MPSTRTYRLRQPGLPPGTVLTRLIRGAEQADYSPAYCDERRVEPTATACTVLYVKKQISNSPTISAGHCSLTSSSSYIQTKQAHWNVVGVSFPRHPSSLDEGYRCRAQKALSPTRWPESGCTCAPRSHPTAALPRTVSTSTLSNFPGTRSDAAEVVTPDHRSTRYRCRHLHAGCADPRVDEADFPLRTSCTRVIRALRAVHAWMVSAESLKPHRRNASTGLSGLRPPWRAGRR
jgi:hypothetical protein